jgi:MerR family transcriptional regulator, light-induced transcriptional regulator
MPSAQTRGSKNTAATQSLDAHYRSGAVARMVRMPVATLRVWERRYGVATPITTHSGHRLYSAEQVQRLAMLKQLTDLGHAIGAIATLAMPQLQQVARTHAKSLQTSQSAAAAAGTMADAAPNPKPRTALVVGAALAQRLARPAWQQAARGAGLFLRVVAVQAGQPKRAALIVLHVAGVQLAGVAAIASQLRALAEQHGAGQTVLVFGHASVAAQQALAAQGLLLCQDTPQDALLAERLAAVLLPAAGAAPAPAPTSVLGLTPTLHIPKRRYDDAVLADLAGLSSTIACECPQHVASLLMQLSHFEDYSAQCQEMGQKQGQNEGQKQGNSVRDAAVHAYLQQVAGSARALFEDALERVAVHEGLMLPGAAAPAPSRQRRSKP